MPIAAVMVKVWDTLNAEKKAMPIAAVMVKEEVTSNVAEEATLTQDVTATNLMS